MKFRLTRTQRKIRFALLLICTAYLITIGVKNITHEKHEVINNDIVYAIENISVQESVEPKTFIANLKETNLLKRQYEIMKPLIETISEYNKLNKYISKYKGNDFTVDDYLMVKEVSNYYGVPIEISLAIIEVESNFYSAAANPDSSAGGYYQVLSSTGKWLYEKVLPEEIRTKYGAWSDDMRFNKEISIYLGNSYLAFNYKGDWSRSIRRYYGSIHEENNNIYLNKVINKTNNILKEVY